MCLLCALFAFTFNAHAGQWVEVGDAKLRHHLQVLADAGVLTTPLTTWPVMWGGVHKDLEAWQQAGNEDKDENKNKNKSSTSSVKPQLSRLQQRAFAYVLAAYQNQALERETKVAAEFREAINIHPTFSNNQREEQLLQFSTEQSYEKFAYKLQIQGLNDASDDKEFRLDGSYIAGYMGNWQVSAGAIDRWWGPGWHGDLMLSNSARPVPGLALQRNNTDAFTAPVLRWLGPWQLVLFAGLLENDRAIPHPNLLGMRFTMKPFKWLELGVNRTAQWGGEGRTRSLESFIDLVLGNDNGDTGFSKDANPGNQLGSIDFRLGFSVLGQTLAWYGQMAGEDETNYAPSKRFVMTGIESAFDLLNIQSRLYLEYTDTIANGYKADERYNVAYEHSNYQTGYRYRNRPIGFALDNDTRVLSVAGMHYFKNSNAFNWSLSKIKLNIDGTNRPVGGNVWTTARQDFWLGDVSFEHGFNKLTLNVGLQHFSNDVDDTHIYTGVVFRL